MDEFVVGPPVESASAPIDPRRALLLPLWRGRYLVLVATLLGIAGGVLSGVIRPNTYRSVGKLMIRPGAREQLTPEMSVTGNAGGYGLGGRNVVNDELHLLGTLEVYEEAAHSVTPAEVFRPYDPSENDKTSGPLALFHSWQSWWFGRVTDSSDRPRHAIDKCADCQHAAALAMIRNLTVQAEPGSDVITVSYTTHDPVLAKKVLEAYLESAVQHHREIYAADTTLEFLRDQMSQSKQKLDEAEVEFARFKKECDLLDLADERRALIVELQALDGQISLDQSHIEELGARMQELGALIDSLPETIDERTEHNWLPNPNRGLRQQHIFTLEDERTTVERREGGTTESQERARLELTRLIESEIQELAKQPEFLDSGPTVRKVPNPRREQLTQQRDAATAELPALKAATATRSARQLKQSARLAFLSQSEPGYNLRKRATDEARIGYEGYFSAYVRVSPMGSLDQLNMSNLRLLQAATLPDEKEGPQRGKLLVLGILLGLVAGCGLAFARNMFDHRLHDATEVEQLLGLPVLGVFPRGRSRSGSRWRGRWRAAS